MNTTESTEGAKEMSDLAMLKLCDTVRQTAFELHTFLRHGHFEKVYENGLSSRLRKKGLSVQPQHQLKISDEDGTVLGEFVADLLVEDLLIVELKACKALGNEHMAQAFGYLRASGRRHAMIINFGAPKIHFKKIVL